MILAGCTTQEGAGASALAFSAVEIGSTVGVTRVQKAHVSELYVDVRWNTVGLSDVYWNYKMIEQVNGHWEFNLRDHVFAFSEI